MSALRKISLSLLFSAIAVTIWWAWTYHGKPNNDSQPTAELNKTTGNRPSSPSKESEKSNLEIIEGIGFEGMWVADPVIGDLYADNINSLAIVQNDDGKYCMFPGLDKSNILTCIISKENKMNAKFDSEEVCSIEYQKEHDIISVTWKYSKNGQVVKMTRMPKSVFSSIMHHKDIREEEGKSREDEERGKIQAEEESLGTWPVPRFTDNKNGSVTDNLTHLIWTKNANLLHPNGINEAISFCSSLSSGRSGLSDGSSAGDWRLPTKEEMRSLFTVRFDSPAISNSTGSEKWTEGDPFVEIQGHGYYLTTSKDEYDHYWAVHSMDKYHGIGTLSASTRLGIAWPVRGKMILGDNSHAQPAKTGTDDNNHLHGQLSRFKDEGNGTIMDTHTGLIWLKNADAIGRLSWEDADLACRSLSSGSLGLTDGSIEGKWRLPTKNELVSLLSTERGGLGLPKEHPFMSVRLDQCYWSSTSCVEDAGMAWDICFRTGEMGKYVKFLKQNVWPVRDGR